MIHFDDLLYCDDETFIFNCYRQLLGRDPDPAGFAHHVERLKSGRPRANIARLLLRSTEGRVHAQKVKGLRFALLWTRLNAVPVVGYLFRSLSWHHGAGDVSRRVRAVENLTARLVDIAEEEAAKAADLRGRRRKRAGPGSVPLSPRGRAIFDELKA